MTNSTTGIMPAPTPVPHHEVPQQPTITLYLDDIRQVDGLYCLNDLHKMAGGRDKHRPTYFFRSEIAKSTIAELDREFKTCEILTPYMITVIGKGKQQGTYVCRELVYTYANWISPAFYLVVIRTFDRLTNLTLTERYNLKDSEYKTLKSEVSGYASKLCIHGKKTLPRMVRELKELLEQMQPQLPFEGGSNDN